MKRPAMQKVTIVLPRELVKRAVSATGQGITPTIRRGLEVVARASAYEGLRKLRGKVRFSINAGELRADGLICVDTNCWIAYLSGRAGPDVDLLEECLERESVLMAPVVLAELLSDPLLPPLAESYLISIQCLEITTGYWRRAGKLRAELWRRGHRPKLADTLIAQTCVDHNIPGPETVCDFQPFVKYGGLELAGYEPDTLSVGEDARVKPRGLNWLPKKKNGSKGPNSQPAPAPASSVGTWRLPPPSGVLEAPPTPPFSDMKLNASKPGRS